MVIKKTEKELILTIARIIRGIRRHVDDLNIIPIVVEIVYDGDNTLVLCNEKTYLVEKSLSKDKLIHDIMFQCKAYCHCSYMPNDNVFKIFAYKKPVKEFNRLNNLLKKRIDVTLNWYDVFTKYHGLGEEITDYLCYNPYACMEAIQFIQDNKDFNFYKIKENDMQYIELSSKHKKIEIKA